MTTSRYIGKTLPRPEGADKAAGKAHYIHDLERPGMLYGKIKFSEHAHALIKHIDISKAERLAGVRAVITAANTSEIRLGFLHDNFALKKEKVFHPDWKEGVWLLAWRTNCRHCLMVM